MNEKQKNILIVDDDKQTRLKLTRALARPDYAVSSVEDGNEALQMLSAKPFDLILLDILMPKMDGIEVLKQLQADTSRKMPEVIVISAVEDPESIQRCRQLGARYYLTKPVDADLLNARVKEALAGKGIPETNE
jgi:CheY-like chemotaxis protein